MKHSIQLIKPDSRLDRFLARHLSSEIFTYQQILGMLGPLILDQFFVYLINMLTTSMVSSSGQDSVSAVSLVAPVNMMVMSLFTAIGSGGSVVVAQYKGKGDMQKMRHAAGQVVLATFLVALAAAAFLFTFATPLVNLLFGEAELSVRTKAAQYLMGMSISFITFSLYQGTFSVLRGTGDTKTCLRLTVIINVIHLFASMLFLNVFKLDILGTTLSFNLARIIGGGAAVYLLMSPRGSLGIRLREIFRRDFPILKAVFRMGIPFAAEQIFLNGGALIVQAYIVPLGTVSIAANAIGNSVLSLFYGAGFAVSTLAITVIGQCVGARNIDQAKRYGRQMIVLGTIMEVLSIVVLYPRLPLLIGLNHPEPETLVLIQRLMLYAILPLPFFWASSNIMPSTLRAAGDASFTSIASLVTMWTMRVGVGYVLSIVLGMGIRGVWLGMAVEWAARSVIFWLRFSGKKWYAKKAIE